MRVFSLGSLTAYLQKEFIRQCPPHWKCRSECRLMSEHLEKTLGYAARADVMLERVDGSRRLWVEFEVSRADPVANHAKFATAHLFEPRPAQDVFVSMVSSHVTRGRANLAANAIALMRSVGMNAFQTVLLPGFSPERVKCLNHLPLVALPEQGIAVSEEIDRALAVSEATVTLERVSIHYASNILEIMLNLKRWNEDITTADAGRVWGRRVVTYFVFDAISSDFAPSKFCAYITLETAVRALIGGISICTYARIDQTEPIFDGARARLHLTRRLGMTIADASERSAIFPLFEAWLRRNAESIAVHPDGPQFIIPPMWSR